MDAVRAIDGIVGEDGDDDSIESGVPGGSKSTGHNALGRMRRFPKDNFFVRLCLSE